MNNMKDAIELSDSEISEFIEKDALCWQKANEVGGSLHFKSSLVLHPGYSVTDF